MHLQTGPSVVMGEYGVLAILFEYLFDGGDEVGSIVTFVLQLEHNPRRYFVDHVYYGKLKKLFPDVNITYPVSAGDSSTPTKTNLVFSKAIDGSLRDPVGLLRAVKRQLLPIIREAEVAAWRDEDPRKSRKC